jgi:predicted RNA binding protein YcfA (HicA-like mRNA interferase family)
MTKLDKLLERMRDNPRDWRIEDLESLGRRHGITVRRPPGSHVVFQHPDSALTVTVPAGRPIKPVYIRKFLELVDQMEDKDEV